VFENRVLRKVFGPKSDKVTGTGGDGIARAFMIYIPYQVLDGLPKQEE
jgi:hypothetical protein